MYIYIYIYIYIQLYIYNNIRMILFGIYSNSSTYNGCTADIFFASSG